jgi:hypothetical protein
MMKQLVLIGVCAGLMAMTAIGEEQKIDSPNSAVDGKTNAVPSKASEAGTITKDYAVQSGGTLHLTFPKAWNDFPRQFKQKDNSMLQMVQFHPPVGNDFAVIVEFESLAEDKSKDVNIKKLLTEAARLELPNSIEKSVEIHELKGTQIEGAYFTLTDKHLLLALPQPGEFKYLTQGYAKLHGLVLNFRVASNRFNSAEKQSAFEMIKSASFTAKQ